MSRALPTTIAVTLILCSCHKDAPLPATSADAEPLRWLDHADVIADFTEHVERQNDTRFVSVFAFSTASAVGLDDTPEMRELIQQHGERHLEGTTDVISSAEQQRLLHKAGDYVKIQYPFATLSPWPPKHLTSHSSRRLAVLIPSFFMIKILPELASRALARRS